jgi:carboxyl-terminal processing protease
MLQTTLRYLDDNREALQKNYPTMRKFINEFVVDEALLGRLRSMAERDSVKLEGGEEEYQRSIPMLSLQMKALLARDLWDMSEYMEVINTKDDNFLKAYELLQERNIDAVLLKKRKK